MEISKFENLLAPLRKEHQELNTKKLQLTTELDFSFDKNFKHLRASLNELALKAFHSQ